MKRVITHIYVVLVNFYFLSYLVCLIMMMKTSFTGVPIKSNYSIIIILLSLLLSILYQVIRKYFNWLSIGEFLIDNIDKKNILIQKEKFTITRIPFFLITIISLGLVSNFSDGLTDELIYSFGEILIFGLVVSSLYYGLINFVFKPELLPILSILLSLLLFGYSFNLFDNLNNVLSLSVVVICILWVFIALVYKSNFLKT